MWQYQMLFKLKVQFDKEFFLYYFYVIHLYIYFNHKYLILQRWASLLVWRRGFRRVNHDLRNYNENAPACHVTKSDHEFVVRYLSVFISVCHREHLLDLSVRNVFRKILHDHKKFSSWQKVAFKFVLFCPS